VTIVTASMLGADVADVRSYRAAGRQVVGCGHVVEVGEALFEVRLDEEGVTSRSASTCRACLDALGRAGALIAREVGVW